MQEHGEKSDLQATRRTGIVVIGRNEGERLLRSLSSVAGYTTRIVYVDSGSTDNSVAIARGLGISVLELDPSRPFTAARARNEGVQVLRSIHPDIAFIQLIDGDCELVEGWIPAAEQFLSLHPDVAVVCGRRRERYPRATVYNLLCDLEWDTPTGEAESCGGDAMFRVEAFEAVGGFLPYLIAGEEPELCLRLREKGWIVWRLDAEMTKHDAAMTHFGQWWQRTVRGGCGYAQGYTLHKRAPQPIWKRQLVRSVFWSGVLPATVVVGGMLHPIFLCGSLIYPLQMCRIAWRRGFLRRESWTYAFFMMLAKAAEFQGIVRFYRQHLLGKRVSLVEYKKLSN